MESLGHTFGMWTVAGEPATNEHGRSTLLVKCSCGTERRVTTNDLRQGKSRSCGCANPRLGVLGMNAHAESRRGEGKTRLYIVWRAMKQRCLDPNGIGWKYYGGRGVTIHEPWLGFVNFRDWIIANIGRPPAGLSFDRINNEGNYEPGNVRWATRTMQNRNRRRPLRSTKTTP